MRYTVSVNQTVTGTLAAVNEEIVSAFEVIPLAAPRVTYGGPAAPDYLKGVEIQGWLQDSATAQQICGLELVSCRISPHINGTRLAGPTFTTLFNLNPVDTIQGTVTNGYNAFTEPVPAGQGFYIEEIMVRVPIFTPPAAFRMVLIITFVGE